jgi:hypothetical protein
MPKRLNLFIIKHSPSESYSFFAGEDPHDLIAHLGLSESMVVKAPVESNGTPDNAELAQEILVRQVLQTARAQVVISHPDGTKSVDTISWRAKEVTRGDLLVLQRLGIPIRI